MCYWRLAACSPPTNALKKKKTRNKDEVVCLLVARWIKFQLSAYSICSYSFVSMELSALSFSVSVFRVTRTIATFPLSNLLFAHIFIPKKFHIQNEWVQSAYDPSILHVKRWYLTAIQSNAIATVSSMRTGSFIMPFVVHTFIKRLWHEHNVRNVPLFPPWLMIFIIYLLLDGKMVCSTTQCSIAEMVHWWNY